MEIGLVLKLIRRKFESPKVDYKIAYHPSEVKDKKEIVKDVSAMANTVDLDDTLAASGIRGNPGFIIIGADEKTGRLHNISHLRLDDAHFQQLVNENIKPKIRFLFIPFDHEEDGQTIQLGVIVVYESHNPPHRIKKDFRGYKERMCFVREGTSTREARDPDYEKMYAHRSRVTRRTPLLDTSGFLDRDEELDQLEAAWRDEKAKAILVRGLGGIGKSWLVSHFLEHRLAFPIERIFYYDFRQADDFPSLARSLGSFLKLPKPASDNATAFIEGFLNLLAIEERIFFFDNFEEVLLPIAPEERIRLGLGRPRPLKVHDADLALFMDALLCRQHKTKVLIASRYEPDFGRAATYVRTVPPRRLQGLSEEASHKLLERNLGDRSISESDWIRVHKRLEGHPTALIFLGQLLFEGLYTIDELLGEIEDLAKPIVPTPFLERVAEEFLDRLYISLGKEERDCLRRGAVLRREFDWTMIQALVELDERQLRERLELLQHKSLLRRVQPYYSYHPLVQDYAYHLLSQDGAEVYECHTLAAEHYQVLDELKWPWQDEGGVVEALEAIYHWDKAGEEEQAHTLLRKVMGFLKGRGLGYYLQGDLERAKRILETRLEHLKRFRNRSEGEKKRYGKLCFHYANVLAKTGAGTKNVRKHFKLAIEYAPEYPHTWQAWALMEKEVGNYDEARRLFKKGVEADPKSVHTWQGWALMEKDVGNYDEARRLFREATQVNPKDAPTWQA